jgi:hypothetical protein
VLKLRVQFQRADGLVIGVPQLGEELAVGIARPHGMRDVQGQGGLARSGLPGQDGDWQVPGRVRLARGQQPDQAFARLFPASEVGDRGGQLARNPGGRAPGRDRSCRCGLRCDIERRVADQNGPLQRTQILAQVETEFFDEQMASFTRTQASARRRPVEREHVLARSLSRSGYRLTASLSSPVRSWWRPSASSLDAFLEDATRSSFRRVQPDEPVHAVGRRAPPQGQSSRRSSTASASR